jgi:hypothetical protein
MSPTSRKPLAEASTSLANIDPSLQQVMSPADTPNASDPGLSERFVRNPITLFYLKWMHENTEISEYGFYECVVDSV